MLDDEPEFGVFESGCQACEVFGPVDDLGLCAACSAELDRDMIRQRAWDYSSTAFGEGQENREELRAAAEAVMRAGSLTSRCARQPLVRSSAADSVRPQIGTFPCLYGGINPPY
jgi:hypothetical protein